MRGKRPAAIDLFRFGRRLDPVSMLVPPIGHLFSADGSLKRARRAFWDILGNIRP
jgi:hypothetical protein